MTPARGKLTVRPIETAETLPGGKILLTQATREGLTAQQAEVVAVGAPAICDDPLPSRDVAGDCPRPLDAHGLEFPDYSTVRFTHPCTAIVGDWVLLAPRCLVETDTPNLYCCAQDDVIARLEA